MAYLKRRNHYLSVCLQKGFTDVSGRLWVKFAHKDLPEPEPLEPQSVGYANSLYIVEQGGTKDDRVEDFFCDVVETPFGPVSRRIKEEQHRFASITEDERDVVLTFVASQAARTLAHKKCIEEQAGGRVDTNTFVKTLARQSLAILEDWARGVVANPTSIRLFRILVSNSLQETIRWW
jgi:Protein of unknown function (DUF4238)